MKSLVSKILALGAATFSLIALLLPWRWRPRLALKVRAFIYWAATRFKKLHKLYREVALERDEELRDTSVG